MTEKEITCNKCDSDYDGIGEVPNQKIKVRLIYKDKVKEYEVDPWDIW